MPKIRPNPPIHLCTLPSLPWGGGGYTDDGRQSASNNSSPCRLPPAHVTNRAQSWPWPVMVAALWHLPSKQYWEGSMVRNGPLWSTDCPCLESFSH